MRTKSLLEHNLPLILALIVIVTLIIVIQSFQLPVQSHNAKVGCVMIGASQDHGWNESHYTGLLEACRAHDSELLVRENVAEDEESLSSAIDSLIKQGCTVVFLTSFGYGDCAAESVRRHPKVAFFSISGSHRADNYTTYFARLYQVRYLAGIIAGRESKSGILGYVAAMPNAQTLRGINAYALGARHANPKARILLRYTGSWDNEQEERRSVALLQEAGADLITYHEDHPYVIREAESRGLLSIGHDTVYEHYSPRFLTAAVYDWKVIYKRVLGDYLSGRT
nr:BMP family ABC transporter substrate-binding protein [Succinivibrio sp.]